MSLHLSSQLIHINRIIYESLKAFILKLFSNPQASGVCSMLSFCFNKSRFKMCEHLGPCFFLSQNFTEKTLPPRLNRIFKDLASLVIDQATDKGKVLTLKSHWGVFFSENKKQRGVSHAYLKKISSSCFWWSHCVLMNQDKCPGSLRLFCEVYIEDYIRVKHNPLATCPQVMIQSWFRLVWKLLEVCVHINIYIYITRDHQILFFLLCSKRAVFWGCNFNSAQKTASFFRGPSFVVD